MSDDVCDFREYTGVDCFGTELLLPQYRIFVLGRHVGYMGKQPGSVPIIVQPVSDSERRLIEVAASQRDGVERTKSVVAPYIPHGELAEDIDEDDEDND